MKVLHVIPSLSPEWGGPVTVIAELTSALAEKGIESTVFATQGRHVGVNVQSIEAEHHLFPTSGLARLWTGYAPGMLRALREDVQEHDLIHIHELWHYPHYAAYRVAQTAGKRYMVTVHGEMDPWALQQKRRKKWIYMALIQRRILQRAAAVQAITHEEADQIRARGIRAPIAVIPNGIDVDTFQNLPPKSTFIREFPDLYGKQVVLFLGRLHPKKGLDLLARAFARLGSQRDDVRLVVVGPDDGGYRGGIETFLSTSGVLDKSVFTEMLAGDEKLAALAAADIYVLPSWSDVRGVATLEAMAAKLPVIITRQCQFPEVAEESAGLVINPDADELHYALVTLLADPERRRAMGERGRQMVMENYTWDSVATQMTQLYSDIGQ